jgi:hypothetical protein
MCVPIFKDPNDWNKVRERRKEPHAVLAIDSDVDLALEFKDSHLKAMLENHSNILYEAVSSGVPNG